MEKLDKSQVTCVQLCLLCNKNTSTPCNVETVLDIQSRMILHWNYRNLKELPDEVLNHGEHIEEIYLKRNCLQKLPTDIGKLKKLTNLYLVGNQLNCLPNEIGDLSCLKVLDMSQNYLQELPVSLGKLELLESLLLTYNQLSETSLKCLRSLHRLKQLELSGNKIRSLPSSIIDGLNALEEIGIDRNPISSLPRNLCRLRNLRYLSACRCNLINLPGLPFHSISSRASRSPKFLFDGNPKLNYIPYWALQQLSSSVECFGCSLDPPGHQCPTSPAETHSPPPVWNDASTVKLSSNGSLHILHFDPDLVQLHRKSTKVPSLLELCLRTVHINDLLHHQPQRGLVEPVVEPIIVPVQAGASFLPTSYHTSASPTSQNLNFTEDTEDILLPANLHKILQLGPVSKCFHCLTPIFTESWPVTFQIPDNVLEEIGDHLGKLRISCTQFCSGSCILKFSRGSNFSSNLLLNDLRCIIDRELVWFK